MPLNDNVIAPSFAASGEFVRASLAVKLGIPILLESIRTANSAGLRSRWLTINKAFLGFVHALTFTASESALATGSDQYGRQRASATPKRSIARQIGVTFGRLCG